MTEKKTFKNEPPGFVNDQRIRGWNMSTGEVFMTDEWDMEVTFTKKAVKPEVGGTCKLAKSNIFDSVVFQIIAVNDDLVWIRQLGVPAEEDTGWVEPVYNLTDVKPWQPA